MIFTLSPIIMVQWKITLNEGKLILEIHPPYWILEQHCRKVLPYPSSRNSKPNQAAYWNVNLCLFAIRP